MVKPPLSHTFQPTLCEGSDIRARAWCLPLPCFNPRSREGSDLLMTCSEAVGCVAC